MQIRVDYKDGLQHVLRQQIYKNNKDQRWADLKKEQPNPTAMPSEQHENNKTTLIVGCIVAGLIAFIIYEIY